MFSDLHIPLDVVWYLVYNEYCHGTPQVTDEQIIVILHLVLQVYCSPSLKEQIHNPVMPLLARNKERKETILRAHGGMCACVCVCGGCVMWVCCCVYICICVIISASAFRMLDTNLQVYVHVSVITQVQ